MGKPRTQTNSRNHPKRAAHRSCAARGARSRQNQQNGYLTFQCSGTKGRRPQVTPLGLNSKATCPRTAAQGPSMAPQSMKRYTVATQNQSVIRAVEHRAGHRRAAPLGAKWGGPPSDTAVATERNMRRARKIKALRFHCAFNGLAMRLHPQGSKDVISSIPTDCISLPLHGVCRKCPVHWNS